jgi:hypothetical protein
MFTRNATPSVKRDWRELPEKAMLGIMRCGWRGDDAAVRGVRTPGFMMAPHSRLGRGRVGPEPRAGIRAWFLGFAPSRFMMAPRSRLGRTGVGPEPRAGKRRLFRRVRMLEKCCRTAKYCKQTGPSNRISNEQTRAVCRFGISGSDLRRPALHLKPQSVAVDSRDCNHRSTILYTMSN